MNAATATCFTAVDGMPFSSYASCDVSGPYAFVDPVQAYARKIGDFQVIWVSFLIVFCALLAGTLFAAWVLYMRQCDEVPMPSTSWQLVPNAYGQTRFGRLCTMAYFFEQIANTLDRLNLVLMGVLAVAGADSRGFRTQSLLVIVLVLFIVLSQVPRLFGNGLIQVPLPHVKTLGLESKAVILGVDAYVFWSIRIFTIVLEVVQGILGALPLKCEMGNGLASYCRQGIGDTLVTSEVAAFLFILTIVEAVTRIVACLIFISVVIGTEDAGYDMFRCYRFENLVHEEGAGYRVAFRKIPLPRGRRYIARHLYELRYYKSLVYPEVTLLAAGIIPPVMFQKTARDAQDIMWDESRQILPPWAIPTGRMLKSPWYRTAALEQIRASLCVLAQKVEWTSQDRQFGSQCHC